MSRGRVLFCGTGGFAETCLQKVLSLNLFNVTVVTPKVKRVGRSFKEQQVSRVRQLAMEKGLQILDAPQERKFKLSQNKDTTNLDGNDVSYFKGFELGIVVDFGYFLPSELILAMNHGFLNVHPSLLPRYRGAAPIEHALLNGIPKLGCL